MSLISDYPFIHSLPMKGALIDAASLRTSQMFLAMVAVAATACIVTRHTTLSQCLHLG